MRTPLCVACAAMVIAITMAFAACGDYGYDAGEGAMSYMKADYADITIAGHEVKTIVTDDGVSLVTARPMPVSHDVPADTVLRKLLYYNGICGTRVVEVLKTTPVAVVRAHPRDEVAGMGTDPVRLSGAWVSPGRRYLNLRLGVMTGGDVPAGAGQVLALRLDSVSEAGGGRTFLTLCHDQAGVPEYYTEELHVSTPRPATDTVTVTINTYSGIVTRDFTR